MFARAALRATARPLSAVRAQTPAIGKRAYTVDQGAVSLHFAFAWTMLTSALQAYQVREFFKLNPVPKEAYPLIAITGFMCTFAGYHLYKNIHEDRSHVSLSHKASGIKHG